MKERGCSGKTIDCYISAVRMAHLTRGFDCPHLRQPIIKIILKGQMHQDSLRQKLERKSTRLPVTIPVMRYIKHKLISTNWSFEKCLLVWAVAATLWNGAMRVHEALAREVMSFDQTTTLLLEDIDFVKVTIDGKQTDMLKLKLKCPKESSIGHGIVIEIFKNDSFLCAHKAIKNYQKYTKVKLEAEKPFFRKEDGSNYTGREFNKDLASITNAITEGTEGTFQSHSFRSGVATEMGMAGYSDQEIREALFYFKCISLIWTFGF